MLPLFAIVSMLVVSLSLPPDASAQIDPEDVSCHFKIPKIFYPKLRYLCEDVDRFTNCLVDKKVISQDESEELKLLLEKDENCKFAENNEDMKEDVERMLRNEELCFKFKDLSHHLFAVMKCLKKPI